MQRWKTHPAIRAHIEGGKRIGYGARAINNGTPQALPKLVFPGGALVGCDAGFLNAARIKGSHAAIKSGMLVAESIAPALAAGRAQDELTAYPEAFEASWLNEELQQTRNFKLWFKKGGKTVGQLMTGIEQWLLPKLGVQSPPWTLHNHKADHEALRPASSLPGDRLPQARRQAQLRQAVFGVHLEHQPRRGPAGAPDAEERQPCRWRPISPSTPAPRAATARPGSTSS